MTTIRFEHISKNFGTNVVVGKFDLTIESGEFFTFVGPSGCGKSTILNMIAGLEQPTDGALFFDDSVVNSLSPKDRDVAMVFQSYALYPHFSVFENIAFPLRMQKERKDTIEREVKRVATVLGLSDFLTKKPKQLSGGQRQRVALGRALVRKPKVFLMDEPLSNLDARLRIEMRAELKRLHRELGITTVYVTHDQSEAMGLSDRIAVLDKGIVRQIGAPHEVYRRPANTFVARFIGSPAMNILRCVVEHPAPLAVRLPGTSLVLPRSVPAATRELLLGIRPEDMVIRKSRVQGSIPMTVSVVEPGGAVNWIDLVRENIKLTVMSAPDVRLDAGEECFVSFSAEKISLFDATSGDSIADARALKAA